MVQQLPKRKVPVGSYWDVVSQSLPVDCGVTHGSILCPVVFTVCTDDKLTLPKFCQTATVTLMILNFT